MSTQFHIPKNSASTTVAVARSAGGTSLTVVSGSVFGSTFPIIITAIRAGTVLCILEATGRTGSVLTLNPSAIEGTTDAALQIGDTVEMRPTALAVTELQAAINTNDALAAHLAGAEVFTGAKTFAAHTTMAVTNPGGAVLQVQNLDATGYSALDIYDHLGAQQGGFGYGNPGTVGTTSGVVYVYSLGSIAFIVNGNTLAMMDHTDGSTSFGGAIAAANLSGTNTGDQTTVSGNAGTATNGVVTTGSYADPAWITSLAGAKVTGNIAGTAGGLSANIAESQVTGLVADLAARTQSFATTIGDNAATTYTVTHNLGTKDVEAAFRFTADDSACMTTWTAATINTITVTFAEAPATNAIRVVVVGI